MDKSSSFRVTTSRHFSHWLVEQRTALAFTTYQAGRLFFIGTNSQQELSAFERMFPRCMGLWTNGQTMWVSSSYQLWRLENTLAAGEQSDGYDRCFVPQASLVTGDLDIHDVVGTGDEPLFVNTLFSCLAKANPRYSFCPVWKPPFISRLAPEDRCHLNGVAMRDGEPAYVTACSQSDVVEGWRNHRERGGCIVDVQQQAVVAEGLSMPHSPRWRDGKLWFLNSGSGFLGFLDVEAGQFEEVCFCPGFTRGLALVGDYAVVGVSECREERTFHHLALERHLEQRSASPMCGLLVINTRTGVVEHWLRIEGIVQELYDVVAIPGASRPKALGFKTEEICRHVWLEQDGLAERWQQGPN